MRSQQGRVPRHHPVGVTLAAVAAAVLLLPARLLAGDWYVDQAADCASGDGSEAHPFCRILEAVQVALNADTIHIAPGTYFENVVLAKDLTLIGTAGQIVTRVDGSAADRVMQVTTGTTVHVAGLTLTNGFVSGSDGGGVLNQGALTLSSSTVSGNQAIKTVSGTGQGGGIFNDGGALTLVDCSISGNAAFSCAGICNVDGSVSATDCAIRDNDAEDYAGGIGSDGDVVLRRCAVDANATSVWLAGGIYNGGTMTLINTTVTGNQLRSWVGYGGGIFNGYDGTLLLDGCTVRGNSAIFGGGILNNFGSVEISDSLIAGNSAWYEGGGLWNRGTFSLSTSTVAGNHCDGRGGGIFDHNSGPFHLGHTVLAGNTAAAGPDCNGTLYSTGHNLVGDTRDCALTGDGTGNLLDVDPLFVDPIGGDFSLQPFSPCVDAGEPTLRLAGMDLAANPRVLDGDLDRRMVVDMGAFEYNNTRLKVTGDAVPGGTLTVDLGGAARLDGWLFVGVALGEIPFPPYGALFVDLSSAWSLFFVGTLPASLQGTIPGNTPPGTHLVFQGLGLGVASGNCSNVVTVVIE